MSTAVDIEAAIQHLPASERAKLRERLLENAGVKPKTGAELAAIWSGSVHLTAEEAEEFGRDLEAVHQAPTKAPVWE